MGSGREGPAILLLGPVQLRVGGQPRPLRGRKQRIAMVRLALGEGRPVPVDSLVDDLWPGKPPKDPLHALQAHMSRLRTVAEVDVELVNGGYRLADPDVEVDAKQFAELCERGRARIAAGEAGPAAEDLDAALGLWRGSALGDLGDLHGLRPFVLRLDEMRREAASERVEAYLQCGQGESLISELRSSLGLDPLQEPAWHQLMRALWQTGREAEALATYGRAREAFIERLGVEPGSQLSELHGMILRGMPPTDTPQLSSARSTSVSAPTVAPASGLIGRSDEMATLQNLWSRLQHGFWQQRRSGMRIVTLSGEPGIGKTRLIDEFSHTVAATGATVLSGHCDRSISLPYQPFAHMLQACLDGSRDVEAELRRRASELANVLPTIGARLGGSDPDESSSDGSSADHGTDHHRTMDAVAAWLSALSRRQPVLLTIDDLQWADEETLLLVQHLIRTPREMDVLVVVGVRDRQVANTEDSPASDVLRQSASVTHLALERFTDDEATALIEAEEALSAGAGTLPAWADGFVRSAAGGNPLFVLELTRQLLMVDDTDHGRIPAPPAGVTRVVESRVARLSGDTQSLLQLASVFGTGFQLSRLEEVWERSREDLDAALHAALRSRLIEPSASDRLGYVFSHDIVRTVIYDLLPPSQRARLHTRIASVIEASHPGDETGDHQVLAHHYRRSDLPDAMLLAARHLHAAGQDALGRGAPAEAASLLSEALDLVGTNNHSRFRCELLLGLGTAQLKLARPEYRSTLLEATRLANSVEDTDLLTATVLANNRGWWSSAVDLDHERIANIETALARGAEDGSSSRAQLLMAWAVENVRHPSSRDSVLAASSQAMVLAEQSGDPDTLASVLSHRYAVMFALFEDPVTCMRINEQLLSLANQYGDQQIRMSAALGLAQSGMRLGEFAIADRYLSEAEHLAETLGHPPRLWMVRGWQAMRTALRGRLDTAEELAKEAYELGARTEQADAFTWFAGQLFSIRMMQGRLPEIVDAVQQQVESVADGVPAWRAAMALALACSNRLDAAEAIVDEFAVDNFDRLPRDMLWLNGLHYFSMTCEVLERGDVAAGLYRMLLPYSGMVATTATIDAGPVDLQLGVLARLSGQRDLADRHLQAAGALCRRNDAPVWSDQAVQRLSVGVDRASHLTTTSRL